MSLIEADSYTPDFLKQHHIASGQPTALNLVFVNSLTGLVSGELKSHTEKIYYFVVNFTREHIEGLVSHARGGDDEESNFKTMVKVMYQGGANSNIGTLDVLETYAAEEIRMLEEE